MAHPGLQASPSPIPALTCEDRSGGVPFCFAEVLLPDLTKRTTQSRWDLRDGEDRRRFYAMMLTLGGGDDIVKCVDGALLVDLWRDIDLPRPVRAAWDPIVREAARGSTAPW